MLILHVTSSRFCLYLLNVFHFTYTFSYAHTEAHTHKHTCTIGTQQEWRQPGTGAWLRAAEERLLLEILHKVHVLQAWIMIKFPGEKETKASQPWLHSDLLAKRWRTCTLNVLHFSKYTSFMKDMYFDKKKNMSEKSRYESKEKDSST